MRSLIKKNSFYLIQSWSIQWFIDYDTPYIGIVLWINVWVVDRSLIVVVSSYSLRHSSGCMLVLIASTYSSAKHWCRLRWSLGIEDRIYQMLVGSVVCCIQKMTMFQDFRFFLVCSIFKVKKESVCF